MVVALNMADELRAAGVRIDRDLLQDLLGVPVIETVATKGSGIAQLVDSLERARVGYGSQELDAPLLEMAARCGTRAEALMVLEGDEAVAERHGIDPGTQRSEIYTHRRERVNDVVGHVLTETIEGARLSTKLSHAMMHPATGLPLLGLLLWAMYVVLGQWIAGGVVGLLEETLMQGYWEPFVRGVVGSLRIARDGPPHHSGWRVRCAHDGAHVPGRGDPAAGDRVLPLARAARRFGLSAENRCACRSLLGGDRAQWPCGHSADPRSRLRHDGNAYDAHSRLASRAVHRNGAHGHRCSMLGTACGDRGIDGRSRTVVRCRILRCAAADLRIVGAVLNKLTPGVSTDLLIDLPSLRLPRADNVLRKTVTKAWNFMKEVAVFFVAGALLISILDVSGALAWIQNALIPLTVGWLGLPPEAATAFVMGFVRRDFGAAGFFTMNLTSAQLLVSMVTITLFVPCIASIMVILKERGWAYLTGLLVGSVSIAFFVGGVLARILGVA